MAYGTRGPSQGRRPACFLRHIQRQMSQILPIYPLVCDLVYSTGYEGEPESHIYSNQGHLLMAPSRAPLSNSAAVPNFASAFFTSISRAIVVAETWSL